jgi:hypothetical protein
VEFPQVNGGVSEPWGWRRSTDKQVSVLRIALGLVSCFIGTFEFMVISFLFGTG